MGKTRLCGVRSGGPWFEGFFSIPLCWRFQTFSKSDHDNDIDDNDNDVGDGGNDNGYGNITNNNEPNQMN